MIKFLNIFLNVIPTEVEESFLSTRDFSIQFYAISTPLNLT